MKANYQKLDKWILQPVLIGLVTVGAIATKSEAAVFSHDAIATPNSTAQLVAQNKAIYRSDRFGFQFSYFLRDFVVVEKAASDDANSPVWGIDIWTKSHAQQIRNGEYDNGTEYPAHVTLAIYNNRNKLPLQKWIQQSNDFSDSRNFKWTRLSGQKAIKFVSSGLYENEHIAYVNPRDSRIVVLTLSKTGYGNNDALYRQAYQQVLYSFSCE